MSHTLDAGRDRRTKSVHITSEPTKPVHKKGLWGKIVMQFKAMKQAGKIIKGHNEAEKIQSGAKKARNFDDFLKEL